MDEARMMRIVSEAVGWGRRGCLDPHAPTSRGPALRPALLVVSSAFEQTTEGNIRLHRGKKNEAEVIEWPR